MGSDWVGLEIILAYISFGVSFGIPLVDLVRLKAYIDFIVSEQDLNLPFRNEIISRVTSSIT